MSIADLTDIYTLFAIGIGIGIVISAFPFVIGYFINAVFSLINKNV